MTNGICWNSVSSCCPNTSDPIRSTKIPKTRAHITCGIHTHTEPPIPRQAHFPHCGRNHQLLLGELDDRYSGLLHSSSLNPHVVCAVPKSDPGLRLALKVFSCALAVEFGPTRVFIDTCTVVAIRPKTYVAEAVYPGTSLENCEPEKIQKRAGYLRATALRMNLYLSPWTNKVPWVRLPKSSLTASSSPRNAQSHPKPTGCVSLPLKVPSHDAPYTLRN